MKRKLVSQAGSAFTITLPIEWIRENSLKAGDEVELDPSEKSIIIRSYGKAAPLKAKADFTGFTSGRVRLYMSALYARGFDEVEAKCDIDIHNEISQNIGYAVTHCKGGVCRVRDISGVAAEGQDEIFKRVFQMLIAFYERAVNDLFIEQRAEVSTVRSSDGEINKFTLFLERSIMKHAYSDSAAGKVMFAYADSLERIGDDIYRLWVVGIENKIKKDPLIREIVLLSKKGLEKAFEVRYQFSDRKIVELRGIKEELRRKIAKVKNIDGAAAQLIGQASSIMNECTDLTHLVLMMNTPVE
jgi:phosphate uptake regulator